METPSWPH